MNEEKTHTEGRSQCLLLDLHYLPCLAYFAALVEYDEIRLEAMEHYPKQTYRNRCRILTSQKITTLSVPVLKTGSKQLMKDVRIDYSQSWLKDHWRTLTSAYGKAPFFYDFASFFEKILFKRYTFLFDLNIELLTNCLFLLRVKINIDKTSVYQPEVPEVEKPIHDLRNAIQLNSEGFRENLYKPVYYRQLFGSNFAPNLSIVDLLFCQGPEAINIIRQSIFR